MGTGGVPAQDEGGQLALIEKQYVQKRLLEDSTCPRLKSFFIWRGSAGALA